MLLSAIFAGARAAPIARLHAILEDPLDAGQARGEVGLRLCGGGAGSYRGGLITISNQPQLKRGCTYGNRRHHAPRNYFESLGSLALDLERGLERAGCKQQRIYRCCCGGRRK